MSSDVSTFFKIEPLRADNWLPWKRRVEALLTDRDLIGYVNGSITRVVPADKATPTAEEATKMSTWGAKDGKAQSQIVLTVSDTEMVHLSGATTAKAMWDQLRTVKEPKGKLGIMAARRRLYRTYADEGVDVVEHISKFRKIQEELALMGSVVSDEDFTMLLITSLPESWDTFTSAYFGSASGTSGASITSHELVAILIDEDRRRKERNGSSSDSAFVARGGSSFNSQKPRFSSGGASSQGH